MASDEIHELVVSLAPEGVDETTEGLEAVSEQFEDTAAEAESSAAVMERFSQKWQGALQVAVTALGVATAGLLSQVPVLGEVASGVFAIIDALALKMDSVLRPALGPLSEALFGLADAINSLDGPLGTVVGVVATVVSVLGGLAAAVVATAAATGNLGAVFGAVSTAASAIGGAILTVVGILGGPLTAAILAIIAIAGTLLVAWRENWFGVRDLTAQAVQTLRGVFGQLATAVVDLAATVTQTVTAFADGLVTSIELLGARLHTGFETMWDLAVNATKVGVNRVLALVERMANSIMSALPDVVTAELGFSSVSLPRFETQSTSEILGDAEQRLSRRDRQLTGGAGDGSTQVDRLLQEMARSEVKTVLELDSRTVAQSSEPFLGTGVADQGRVFRGR